MIIFSPNEILNNKIMRRIHLVVFDLIILGLIVFWLILKWNIFNNLQIGGFIFAILIWMYISFMTITWKYIDFRDRFKIKKFKKEWFND